MRVYADMDPKTRAAFEKGRLLLEEYAAKLDAHASLQQELAKSQAGLAEFVRRVAEEFRQ